MFLRTTKRRRKQWNRSVWQAYIQFLACNIVSPMVLYHRILVSCDVCKQISRARRATKTERTRQMFLDTLAMNDSDVVKGREVLPVTSRGRLISFAFSIV